MDRIMDMGMKGRERKWSTYVGDDGHEGASEMG